VYSLYARGGECVTPQPQDFLAFFLGPDVDRFPLREAVHHPDHFPDLTPGGHDPLVLNVPSPVGLEHHNHDVVTVRVASGLSVDHRCRHVPLPCLDVVPTSYPGNQGPNAR